MAAAVRRGARLALLAVVPFVWGAGDAHAAARPAGSRCLAALHRGFERVADARRITTEACLRIASGSRARSFAACAAGDPLRLVVRARARALADERRACARRARPPLGAAGAVAAAEAAEEAGRALLRGLFGRTPDLAVARLPERKPAAHCQRAVLAQAGRCAAAFVRDYHACAERTLARADDAFDLVACKGGDARGTVVRACDAGIAAAVATCDGEETEALFPGCAGSLAACARGHARRSASLALNAAGALCQDVPIGSLSVEARLQCFEPPPPEPVTYREVPLPPGTRVVTVEDWSGSGELVVSFGAPGVSGTQLASLRSDGSGFRCLTCGSPIAGNLRPVQILADGRRALVSGPNQLVPRWSLLECSPSLADCRSSALVPIELPLDPDPSTPVLQYRVPWVTPDDAWLIWSEVRLRGPGGNLSAMGRLVREADRYRVADARVIAPSLRSLEIGDDPERWRLFTQPFEAKGPALRGGLDWIEAGTPEAGHYDDMVIDLATGDVRRLTHHPDHDEGIRFSPDEQWAVLLSGRTDNRVEFLGLLPRPPYIDWLAFSIHFVAIAGAPGDGLSPGGSAKERDCYVDPWLLDRWFERGDYLGQRLLAPEDGWESVGQNAGGMRWSPDGTEIALLEQRWRRLTTPGEEPASRLRIARLENRDPLPPARRVATVATPEPRWAIRYEDWIVPDTGGLRVVKGRVSGTATIRNDLPSALQGELEVVYRDYSDDGRTVLDGSERIRVPEFLLQGATYEVDLTLRGAHQGRMIGAVVYDFANDVNTGEVVSELDGRVLRGPHTCFEAGLLPVP